MDRVFCIDLDSPRPDVLEFSGAALREDLEFFEVASPLELNNFDRRIFLNERDAESYLEKYKRTLKSLDNNKICLDRKLPAMLYKRRYIVQSLLGEKLETFRHYKKNWSPGQLFNLHDQTFFLTVQLISITEEDEEFLYKFKLP